MTILTTILVAVAHLVLVLMVLPLGGALLLSQGFKKFGGAEQSYGKCANLYCIATSIAFAIPLILAYFLHEKMKVAVFQATFVALQWILLALLFRKFDRQSLLIEAGAVLLTNFLVYCVVSSLFP